MLKLILKKRTAGMRAGMTRAKIAEAAAKLWLSGQTETFSLRDVAKALGVVPATIRAHFKGGMEDLLDEIARRALAALAPPYKPLQDPKDYLRDFFGAMLTTFGQKPRLGRLVVLHLANDPLLCPLFTERICATLAAIAKPKDAAWALQLFLNRLFGLILLETASGLTGEPEAIKAKILKQTSDLSEAEFPTLKLAGEKLAADLMKRGAPGYLDKVALAAAEALIAELAKGGS
jgi:TetR/AcrR family tetracycline transcriptional repressor